MADAPPRGSNSFPYQMMPQQKLAGPGTAEAAPVAAGKVVNEIETWLCYPLLKTVFKNTAASQMICTVAFVLACQAE